MKPKKKKKNAQPSPATAGRELALTVTTVTFPQAMAQDCYSPSGAVPAGTTPTTTFTAWGTCAADTTGVTVQLYINGVAGPAPTVTVAAGAWQAVFPGVTKAGRQLLPFTPCLLLIETDEQANTGIRFSHAPNQNAAAMIEITGITLGAGNSLTITGTVTNMDVAHTSVSATGWPHSCYPGVQSVYGSLDAREFLLGVGSRRYFRGRFDYGRGHAEFHVRHVGRFRASLFRRRAGQRVRGRLLPHLRRNHRQGQQH